MLTRKLAPCERARARDGEKENKKKGEKGEERKKEERESARERKRGVVATMFRERVSIRRFREARGARKRCRDIVARTARGKCTRDEGGGGDYARGIHNENTRARSIDPQNLWYR